MKNFKSILFLVVVLVVIVILGYWAVVTIEPGSVSVERQKQEQLEQKNSELEEEVKRLTYEIQSLKETQVKEEETTDKPSEITPIAPLKYQNLTNDLQKLIDDNITMREKSAGSRVGTVQTFLNLYNNTSKKIDNDYGAGTKADVLNFQKAVKITADGEAGPGTFLKMIEWLKKQPNS
ncbi:hypothetical protein A3B84_00520 [Candidatus Nomurabacteria bacterium RIFCSPHIGHO2_02_FULL_35_13]|uniref:Peptidoglycan binding-like domain-containing protein n=2 Tax=Candidatus Nomuraibacteriota TaxID=1752729 RepID=A0A1F6VPG2_9BACT|nr:MAG: Peptidoglycan binding domain-containing protein [Candidatus Nomurabacteria bacterium GW2011_GWA1_35_8]OGI71335.1 MAG: hypothetical protein A3B84_00520 [Candidatus Nomurabacteria bacterium RIFCSPHIGHO2_02_FULL_35_13]